MLKNCKNCLIQLTEENVSKASNIIYRRICKPCRSKQTIKYQKDNIVERRIYANEYARKVGRVKQYPCITCSNLCYKKYAKAFCSDKCRFMSYVNITDTCWLWLGSKNRSGYGKLCFLDNQHSTAHRVSYQLFNGPIKDDLFVCHTCDNPSCVKPGHLWLGTTQENKKDQLVKDRGGKKLKESDVLEIRKLYDNGIGSATIARLFNVSCSLISNIAKRYCWKHI
jgi:hypothetical protein